MHLRLFSPEASDEVSPRSSLIEFYERWYVPQVTQDRRRRPISFKTIDRRRAAVNWWTRLMAVPGRPEGPAIGEITDEMLAEFQAKLAHASFKRGCWTANSYLLSPTSQRRTMQEVQIVVAASGPRSGRLVRAGLLPEVPAIYVPPIECLPKPTWTTAEARLLIAGIDSFSRPKRWPHTLEALLNLAHATVAFWFYTGHRATSYQRVRWEDLHRDEELDAGRGGWRISLVSVKTGKRDIVAVHPRLMALIDRLRRFDRERVFAWPVLFGTISAWHARWQCRLPADRRFSPQAWRRCHARHVSQTGFEFARRLASQTLGHSSTEVTEAHYTSARDAAIMLLPDLWADIF